MFIAINKLKEQKFDFWKIGFLAVFAVYFANIVFSDPRWSFLDNINLLMHEAGHFVFMIFGNRFLVIAGGTIAQILIPLLFVVYFFITNQRFSGALTMFWLGQSFLNVALYAGDAAQRALPLLGGDSDGHDWGNMLEILGLLSHTDFIAVSIRGIGIFIVLAAVVCGLFASRKEKGRINFSDF